MSHIAANNLTYRLEDGKNIFSGLSFNLHNEKTGLVGDNGVGKTTLVKIIIGEIAPTGGILRAEGKIAYLPQDHSMDNDKTIAEILSEIDLKILKILKINHIDFDRKLLTLSGGERTKVALAKILSARPDYIIMDEPTNNLDRDARRVVYDFIGHWNRGLLVVSHDRELLNLTDQIIEMTEKGLRTYGGNYDNFIAQKQTENAAIERRLGTAAKSYNQAKRAAQSTLDKHMKRSVHGKKNIDKLGLSKSMIDKMKDTSERSGARLIRAHGAAIARKKNIMEDLRGQVVRPDEMNIKLPGTHVPSSKLVLKISDLSFSYGKRRIFNNFNLSLHGPAHLALGGGNGAGKTTLAKLIMKQLTPNHGEIKLGVTRVSYLDQNVEILDHGATLIENMKKISGLDNGAAKEMLAHFLFRGIDVEKIVKTLSGGEKIRAAMACVLSGKTPPQLLILDEPTNNLDVNSIACLERALHEYLGAMILITHDRKFLDNIGMSEEVIL